MKKLTTTEFIERSKTVHRNRFKYDKTVYNGATQKVIITCHEHGDFKQLPHSHLSGNGCQKCAVQKSKMSFPIFLAKAGKAHQGKYNYSKARYKNANTKIIIICPLHGEFLQRPHDHINKKGCPKCGTENSAKASRLTTEQFIDKARTIHDGIYLYTKTKYLNVHSHVIITCRQHGDFLQEANHHLRGHGCPKCGQLNSAKLRSLNTEDFIAKARNIHGDYYSYTKVKYVRSGDDLIITCPVHGDFKQTPYTHLTGSGCNKCAVDRVSQERKLSLDEFISKSRKAHSKNYGYQFVEYANYSTEVKIICPDHGEFFQTPNCHFKGHGCPKCAGVHQYSTFDFIKKSVSIHGEFYDYSKVDYSNAHGYITIICPKHGEFKQKAYHHINGSGCPFCSESGGERRVTNFLNSIGVKFQREKKFKTCQHIRTLAFDFFITFHGQKILIEYHGRQHYMPIDYSGKGEKKAEEEFQLILKRDIIKEQWANEENIPLIIIPYWEFNNMEIYLATKLCKYSSLE